MQGVSDVWLNPRSQVWTRTVDELEQIPAAERPTSLDRCAEPKRTDLAPLCVKKQPRNLSTLLGQLISAITEGLPRSLSVG